jgi:hypothetical protein
LSPLAPVPHSGGFSQPSQLASACALPQLHCMHMRPPAKLGSSSNRLTIDVNEPWQLGVQLMKSHQSGEMLINPITSDPIPAAACDGKTEKNTWENLGYSHLTPIWLGTHVSSLKVVPRHHGRPSSHGVIPRPWTIDTRIRDP